MALFCIFSSPEIYLSEQLQKLSTLAHFVFQHCQKNTTTSGWVSKGCEKIQQNILQIKCSLNSFLT